MSDWNEPIAKLYTSFEDWLKDRNNRCKKYIDAATKNLKYTWYKSDEDIAISDKDKYNKELFNTEDIQEDYKKFLNGKGVIGDPVTQKFQSGNIMADEMAFYIRHAPIVDLMTCGFMEGTAQEFISDLYKNHVNKTRGLSDLSRSKLKG